MHLDIQDELDPDQPWQYLESILSVWIEMIQRQKVAAISNEVGSERYEQHEQGWLVFHGPDRDPLTGLERLTHDAEPWTIVPWTAKDLEEALEGWEMAVETIEEKLPLDDAETTYGLLDAACLDAGKIPNGFARESLSRKLDGHASTSSLLVSGSQTPKTSSASPSLALRPKKTLYLQSSCSAVTKQSPLRVFGGSVGSVTSTTPCCRMLHPRVMYRSVHLGSTSVRVTGPMAIRKKTAAILSSRLTLRMALPKRAMECPRRNPMICFRLVQILSMIATRWLSLPSWKLCVRMLKMDIGLLMNAVWRVE